jgi:hypothetical protein
MRLGSLAHCAVLEPDELSKRYSTCLPRNTKAGKEQAAELAAAGIEAVTESDMALALNMADAVRQHPYAAALLADGKAEQSFGGMTRQLGSGVSAALTGIKAPPSWTSRPAKTPSPAPLPALALPSATIPRPLITSTAPLRIALYS